MIPLPSRVSPGQSVTAAHHNALLAYVLASTPRQGANVYFDYSPNGIRINARAGGAAAASRPPRPFVVRRHALFDDQGEETSAQWEVYLPAGCMAVGDPCAALNPKASTASGHEDDDGDWYAINWADDTIPGTYRIVAHGKQRGRLQEDGGAWPNPQPYVFVGLELVGEDPKEEESTREDYAGDTVAAIIATVTVATVDGGVSRTISQIVEDPIIVEGVRPQTFDLVWSWQPSTAPAKPTIYGVSCVRQSFSVGGTTYQGASDSDALADNATITDMDYVWLKIDTGANPYAIEVAANSTAAIQSTDLIAWVRLYSLKYNQMRDDERSNLNQVPIYRNYAS